MQSQQSQDHERACLAVLIPGFHIILYDLVDLLFQHLHRRFVIDTASQWFADDIAAAVYQICGRKSGDTVGEIYSILRSIIKIQVSVKLPAFQESSLLR